MQNAADDALLFDHFEHSVCGRSREKNKPGTFSATIHLRYLIH